MEATQKVPQSEVADGQQQLASEIVDAQGSEVTKPQADLTKRIKEVQEEAKRYRQALAAERQEKENLTKKQMEEQGQYKELADIFKSKAELAEKQSKALRDSFAMKSVSDAVALEAAKLGCVDTDALIQLMPLDKIPLKEDFSVERDHVKMLLEDFRKNKAYLFQKAAPVFPDAIPGKMPLKVGKPIAEMSKDEIAAELKARFGKK